VRTIAQSDDKMKPKEHYDRHSITIGEQLARQYARMCKSEILLHQYVLSIADQDGIVKRNMEAAIRETGCCRKSVYDAEALLTARRLLSLTRRNGQRFWQVSEGITIDEAESITGDEALVDEAYDIDSEEIIDDTKPKRRFRSWFRRLIWQVK
jgi:hypothetical protein